MTPGPAARICIVEDSLGVARPLERALRLHQNGNYTVETCASAEAALKRLHEVPFDLLISDLCLPGMDGLELIERSQRIRPETRSLLITAFGSTEVENRAQALADAYLPKPFRLRDLIRIVQNTLAKPPPTRMVPPAASAVAPPPVARKRRKNAHLVVIASDFDGTLAREGKVTAETWQMLHQAKLAGLALILVTGRNLDSFLPDGPFAEFCEAIVAENGAVVYFPRRDKIDLPFGQLDSKVIQRLEAYRIPLERGMAIAATWLPHDETVLKVLRESGSGATLEYNRGAVMVLPPGATKGTGLQYALKELGYSTHNVVACGDAENDRSLFNVAELTAAVSNAHPNLKAAADLVLDQPNGAGVQTLITQLLNGPSLAPPARPGRQLLLGQQLSGTPVRLDPFILTETNLGIFGASQSGKSWLAGLLAEELLAKNYQVFIIDPEGDYRGLGTSPRTLVLGRRGESPPAVTDVIYFSEWHETSLVLDLSAYELDDRSEYTQELLLALRGLRARRGRPHFVLVDEIQNLCPSGNGELGRSFAESMQWGGFCIISYRPSQLVTDLLQELDHLLLTRLSLAEEIQVLEPYLSQCHNCAPMLQQLPTLPRGQAFMALGATGNDQEQQEIIKFQVGPRSIPHIRHLNKYLRAALPKSKRFYFHDSDDSYLHRAAANLWEFRKALGEIPLSSIQYHLGRNDFENWLVDVLHDQELARRIRKVAGRQLVDESLRQALLEVVIDRYEELDTLA